MRLSALKADPMAHWVPSVSTGPERRTETRSGQAVGKPIHATVLRIIRIRSDVDVGTVLDDEAEAATSAGWTSDGRTASAVFARRQLRSGVATLTVTVAHIDGSPSHVDVALEHQ